jgi:hypothetical protein
MKKILACAALVVLWAAPDGTKPHEVLKAKDWIREVDQSLR